MTENSEFYLQVGDLRIRDNKQIPYLKTNNDACHLSGDIINWLRMGVPCVQVETNNGCLTGGTLSLKQVLNQAALPGETFEIYNTKVRINPGLTHFCVKRTFQQD